MKGIVLCSSAVSATSTQTTPVGTPTVLTPQQLAANPSLMSVIDPSITSQLFTTGMAIRDTQRVQNKETAHVILFVCVC